MARSWGRTLGCKSIKRRLSDSFFVSSSNIRCSPRISFLFGKRGEVQGPPGRSNRDVEEKSYRASPGCRSRLLQQTIPGKESLGGLASSSGCVKPQQICSEDEILHGDHPVGNVSYSEGRLDGLHGHARCLLPYPHSSEVKEVSQVCLQRKGFSIPSALLWPEYSSAGFYKGPCSISKVCSSGRNEDHIVPGRLAGFSKVKRRDEESQGVHFEAGSGSRHHSELREVPFRADSGNYVSGDDYRQQEFLGFPDPKESGEYAEYCKRVSILRGSSSKIMASAFGAHVLVGEVDCGGQIENETIAILPATTVEKVPSFGKDLGTHLKVSCSRPGMVVRQGQAFKRGLPSGEEPRPNLTIRRLSAGLGCNNRREILFGELDSSRKESSYQQFGIKSSLERFESSGAAGMQQGHFSVCRQYDSLSILGKARGYEVMGSLQSCQGDSFMDRGKGDSPKTSVHKRSEKCHSRCFKSEESANTDRVDTPSSSLSAPLESLGTTSSGLICNKFESQTPQLHVSSPRCSGSSHRRHVATLVQHGRLCLSPVRHDKASNQQISSVSQLQNDPGRAMVASTRMVSRSVGTSRGSSKNIAIQTRPSKPASGEAVTPKPPHSSSDRLETIIRFGRAKGLSKNAAKSIFGARRSSTNHLYQHRWSIYYKWCKDNKKSASRPSLNSLCEFFIFLRRVKKYAVGSIRGFRSMLHTVLRHVNFNISQDQDISDIIRSFQIEGPIASKDVVYWNLDVVLKYLCSEKFEPLVNSSILDLTKKTLFLVTLALAKRVSEVQALSNSVGFTSEGAVVSLTLSFRAKNDFKCKSLPRNFLLKDLSTLVGQEEEVKLCPVRCLKAYLDRTNSHRTPTNKRLFVSPRDPSRPASKNGISYLLKALIKEAHHALQPEFLPILKVKPHEVRAVATSVSFERNMSLNQVMEMAQWRCQSVFASHYLKDICLDYGTCRTLGPFVAAGAVIP